MKGRNPQDDLASSDNLAPSNSPTSSNDVSRSDVVGTWVQQNRPTGPTTLVLNADGTGTETMGTINLPKSRTTLPLTWTNTNSRITYTAQNRIGLSTANYTQTCRLSLDKKAILWGQGKGTTLKKQ